MPPKIKIGPPRAVHLVPVWPEGSRRLDPTSLSTTGTSAGDRVGIPSHGTDGKCIEAVVLLGDFAGGIEVSQDGRQGGDWYPAKPGSAWPVGARTKRSQHLYFRRTGTGSGTIVIAYATDLSDAMAMASAASGNVSVSGGSGSVPSGSFALVTAAGGALAGQSFTRQAGNIGTLVVNRGAGILYLAETAAKATTLLGVRVNPDAGRKWFGPLFWASDAVLSFDTQEDLS